ncbi:MAG: tetratricopeptide repeat protein [Myxococcota bacterium]
MSGDESDETPTVEESEAARLASLETTFLSALALKDGGDFDKAEEQLREILRTEPRLAEPHMELARILLETDRLDDAEAHARQAIEILGGDNGQWTDELPENVVMALAHALLAEILRRRADSDEVLFGDPEVFRALVAEAKSHFETAADLDPKDEYSSYYGFFLGIEDKTGQPVQLELAPAQDAKPPIESDE